MAALFAICVLFKLNGSSVGVWDNLYHDGTVSPKGRLLFKPQEVRSDEWEVWTPAAISQSRQSPPFPAENFSLGGGKAPLVLNLPVRDYTTLFRPQLWGFFVFDFERGFSFLWWTKVFGLLLATSWFFRQLGVRSFGLQLFGAFVTFLSLQWWFSSPAMIPELFATWAICAGCAIRFLRETIWWRLSIAFAGFVLCGINFVLCAYPPAQVPLILLFLTIFIGVLFDQDAETTSVRRGILLLGAAIVVICLVLVPFFIEIRPTLEIVSQTVYPGGRHHTGGTYSIFKLFAGIVAFLETQKAFPRVFLNVCEAPHVFMFWPLIVLMLIAARIRQKIAITPLFLSLVIFVVLLSLYFVVRLPTWVLAGTGLRFTHPRAAMSGLFMADICLTCLFLDRYRDRILGPRTAIAAALAFTAAILFLVWDANRRHPGIFPDWNQIAFAVAADLILLSLFFWEKRRVWLPAAIIAFMALSNAWINPLVRGLSPILDSKIFHAVDKIRAADPEAKWIVYYGLELSELVRATGAKVIGGTKIVPDMELMRQLDPDNRGPFIYNRYAHVLCHVPKTPGDMAFALVEDDLYLMEIDPSLPLMEEIGLRYVVFPQTWTEAEAFGFTLRERIAGTSILIYQRQ